MSADSEDPSKVWFHRHLRATLGDAEAEKLIVEFARMSRRQQAIQRLTVEPDRVVGIVAAAFVEQELTLCIERHLHLSSSKLRQRYDSLSRPSGPLGSFATKIDIGALLGIYSEAVRHDLWHIKEVRNIFAHNIDIDLFETQPVSHFCNNLSFLQSFMCKHEEDVKIKTPTPSGVSVVATHPPEIDIIGTPRNKFITSCRYVVHLLQNINHDENKLQPHV